MRGLTAKSSICAAVSATKSAKPPWARKAASLSPTNTELSERKLNADDPHGARRNQEAAVLSHRRCRQPRAARRALHRAPRLLQSAVAQGQDRTAETRSGQGQDLDDQGRAAFGPG